MLKRMIALLLALSVVLTLGGFSAFAQEQPESSGAPPNILDIVEENVKLTEAEDATVLFQDEEITAIGELISRAEEGIDEFKENTDFSVYSEGAASDSSDYITLETSQLIGAVELDGEIYEEYAINVIMADEQNIHSSVSGQSQGCVMVSTVYAVWKVADNSKIAMRRSEAVITTSVSLSRLEMANLVQIDLGKAYSNSKTVLSPGSGTNSLEAPNTSFIESSFMGYIGITHTLTLTNGLKIEISFEISGSNGDRGKWKT